MSKENESSINRLVSESEELPKLLEKYKKHEIMALLNTIVKQNQQIAELESILEAENQYPQSQSEIINRNFQENGIKIDNTGSAVTDQRFQENAINSQGLQKGDFNQTNLVENEILEAIKRSNKALKQEDIKKFLTEYITQELQDLIKKEQEQKKRIESLKNLIEKKKPKKRTSQIIQQAPGDTNENPNENDNPKEQYPEDQQQKLAEDYFISQTQENQLETEELDPIIEAFRKEVLDEQFKITCQFVNNKFEDGEQTINSPKDLKEFLENPNHKYVKEEIFNNPDYKNQLASIELGGYSKVHKQFKNLYSNIEWASSNENNSRTTSVKNKNGEVICDLQENIVNSPSDITLPDGSVRTIKSHRTIDFPVQIEEGKGPMHLSMSAKDENGKNMPEKDAVYFTAHYGKDGKLKEVTSPVPIKFMGSDDNAAAYIEREGKIYTLPVTQGKYREMMKELGKNKENAIDLSQSVEKEAQDLVVLNSQIETQQPAAQTVQQEVVGRTKEDQHGQVKNQVEYIKANLEAQTKQYKKDNKQNNIQQQKQQKGEFINR